ncbi:MAG: DUF4145 domain-containing protein [Carnobacterium sp.]|uniref:DUF4145 domain-containing protein n=1 Tax=Carnobacterium sp. TaxID=48221 RepID=UPI003C75C66B
MSRLFIDKNEDVFACANKNTYFCSNCEGRTSHTYIRISYDYFRKQAVLIDSKCDSCDHKEIWLVAFEFFYDNEHDETNPIVKFTRETLIYPQTDPIAPTPHKDMPDDIKKVFDESSSVLNLSPRASAALSRLALDMLLPFLGQEKGDINTRIGNLVKGGLPVTIQQSLDALRVIGNHAVHPGKMDLTDDKEIAISLLELLNFIVEDRITQPNKIRNIYSKLPESIRKTIENRDK